MEGSSILVDIASIEDSPEEEQVLRAHLDRYARERGIELEVTWYRLAAEFVTAERRHDLILMDIDLPGMNGMETATLLRTYDTETPLIFVTNLSQYAVRGYEVDALDFIVKPVGYHALSLRMDKAMRVLERRRETRVVLATRGATRVVSASDISHVEVMGHNLVYHLLEAGGTEQVRVRGSMTAAEAQLGGGFVRISNSCLANLSHIRLVQGGSLRMLSGDVLHFSRSRKGPAMETIAAYLGGSI